MVYSRLEVIEFERQLQKLRQELKDSNIRISQEAKDCHTAIEEKDRELDALYQHSQHREKSLGKQIREYQDLALKTRLQAQDQKAQYQVAQKQIFDINNKNKELVREKKELIATAQETVQAVGETGDNMVTPLEIFQEQQWIMASQYEDHINRLQAELTRARATKRKDDGSCL